MTNTVATRTGGAEITESSSAALLVTARRALAEADTLPEITQLADRAAVIRVAAQRAGLSRDAQNDWGEYKLDAERKAGTMLARMAEIKRGGDQRSNSRGDRLVLADLGIDENRSKRWQLLATLPEVDYEAFKAKVRADTEKVITQSAALAVAKHRQREQDKRDRAVAEAAGISLVPTIRLASALDWLAEQDECDLLLTDPPYSTDVEDVREFAHEWLPAALKKVKPTGRAYVCIGAYPHELRSYLEVPSAEFTLANVLVWTYRNTLGPSPSHDYKLNWQAILYYRGPEAPPLDCPEMTEQFSVQDINAPDGRHGDRWHAWQKPDELGNRFVRHASKPGDLVLDPFAGTGTFLLAAARLGRRAAGCDLSEDNIVIAVERGCRRAD